MSIQRTFKRFADLSLNIDLFYTFYLNLTCIFYEICLRILCFTGSSSSWTSKVSTDFSLVASVCLHLKLPLEFLKNVFEYPQRESLVIHHKIGLPFWGASEPTPGSNSRASVCPSVTPWKGYRFICLRFKDFQSSLVVSTFVNIERIYFFRVTVPVLSISPSILIVQVRKLNSVIPRIVILIHIISHTVISLYCFRSIVLMFMSVLGFSVCVLGIAAFMASVVTHLNTQLY